MTCVAAAERGLPLGGRPKGVPRFLLTPVAQFSTQASLLTVRWPAVSPYLLLQAALAAMAAGRDFTIRVRAVGSGNRQAVGANGSSVAPELILSILFRPADVAALRQDMPQSEPGCFCWFACCAAGAGTVSAEALGGCLCSPAEANDLAVAVSATGCVPSTHNGPACPRSRHPSMGGRQQHQQRQRQRAKWKWGGGGAQQRAQACVLFWHRTGNRSTAKGRLAGRHTIRRCQLCVIAAHSRRQRWGPSQPGRLCDGKQRWVAHAVAQDAAAVAATDGCASKLILWCRTLQGSRAGLAPPPLI